MTPELLDAFARAGAVARVDGAVRALVALLEQRKPLFTGR